MREGRGDGAVLLNLFDPMGRMGRIGEGGMIVWTRWTRWTAWTLWTDMDDSFAAFGALREGGGLFPVVSLRSTTGHCITSRWD